MVHIAQMLCPARHCMMAMAFNQKDLSDQDAILKLQNIYEMFWRGNAVKNKCSICNATEFHIEVGATAFAEVEDAEESMRAVGAANRAAAMHFGLKNRRN